MGEPGEPKDPISTTQLVVIDNRIRVVADMTDNAKEASIAESKSKATVAEATHATPARQESVRVGLVIGAVIAIMVIGCVLKIDKEIILAAMGVVGGIYAVPKAIEKWQAHKVAKALVPTK